MLVRIYVEFVRYVEIFPLAKNYPAGASEWFPFCANLDLRKNCIQRRNYPSGTSEFISIWRQLGSYLGVKIPGDSFSGIPLRFHWCLGNNFFCSQLRSSLEFYCRHLGTDLQSPEIPSRGFLVVLPCWGLIRLLVSGELHFPRWGFPILLLSWGTPSITKWKIAYVPLDPVADYIHMLN